MANRQGLAEAVRIEFLIHATRGQRVMLDSDLAEIFGVATSQLNQAGKRNRDRFPADFAFQLTRQEFAALISQSVITKIGRGGRQKTPWVFTAHGAIMLATLLNSPVGVKASIRVVRAFIFLREQLAANKQLARKLAELEGRVDKHDEGLRELFEAIRQLLAAPVVEPAKREIGFHIKENAVRYRVQVQRNN